MKKYRQHFDIRPIAKGRPRVTRSGHTYTPKRTAQYEKEIAESYEGPLFGKEYTLEVTLVFTDKGTSLNIVGHKNPNFKHPLKGDIDNYVKSILDGLNGVAWADDKQIIQLVVSKL